MTVTTPSSQEATVLGSPVYRAARIAICALGIVYALSTVLITGSHRPSFLDTWFYSVVLVLTSLLALARPVLVREGRAAWACVGLGVTLWSIGDIYWSQAYSGVDPAKIPLPGPADAFYIALYPMAYVGLIALARAGARRLPASVWLDGVVTSLAAGAVFSAATLNDILAAAGGDRFAATLTNLSYPIGDLVLLVVSVAALAMVRWRPDPVWWLLGLGAALFAVADTSYLFGVANNTYTDGGWTDGVWMLGLTFMAVAGSIRRRAEIPELHGFTALLVPILFSLAALVVLIVGTFTSLPWITIAMASACLVAAGVRTALTFEQTRELARTQVQAQTDELSGLGNRRLLDARLPQLLAAVPARSQLVLTILTIDHLSEINSVMGYPAGDMILNTVGTRLQQQLPEESVSARLGGAEIAVLQVAGTDPEAVERDTRQLLKSLAGPVAVDGMPVHVELSAGIALAPAHANRPAELIRCAADALRSAKIHRSEVEIYEPGRDAGSELASALAQDLFRAVADHQFVTYYQPKVDLTAGRPVALEGLLRWRHPVRGLIDGETIYPLAAQVGLTRQLTRTLLEAALYNCASWRRNGLPLDVAVDVTATDLLDAQLPYDLARMINSAGLPPSAVTLEIAEEALLIDQRRTAVALGQLRRFGLRLALDHYGRTAPSLAGLRTMPVDELKLHPSFVGSMLRSPQDAAVVRSTVDLARSLGAVAVADGVESRELLDAVMSVGCTVAQGPAVAEPMSVDVLQQWAQAHLPYGTYS